MISARRADKIATALLWTIAMGSVALLVAIVAQLIASALPSLSLGFVFAPLLRPNPW